MSAPRVDAPPLAAIEQLAARIFPPTHPLAIERVAEGVSTYVYRIARGEERFYVRALPEAGASFAPEVAAHRALRARGVAVPEIVHFAHHDDTLGCSIMVTTEIPGRSVAAHGVDDRTANVLYRAGQDLAALNDLAVDGFGWVARDSDRTDHLAAPHRSFRAFATEYLPGDLALLARGPLAARELAVIERAIAAHDSYLDADRGHLAHGDLDLTHIYRDADGYTGIIDLGEIRGTDRWYDLGHFRLHDTERLPVPTLPWLLAGYRSVTPLPENADRRIAFASLLNAVRTLARVLPKRPGSPLIAHATRALRRDLAALNP